MDPATLARHALEAIRAHWGVEAMHWILDMDFDEDRSRARREDLAENLAMLRHVVINVLRLDKSVFGGISVKRKELTWDDENSRRARCGFNNRRDVETNGFHGVRDKIARQ